MRAEQTFVQRASAEPQRRSLGAERLRFEGDVVEAVVRALERRRCVAPERSHAARCSSSSAPLDANGTPSASYSDRCQLTVGWTTSRPSDRRSSVARSLASKQRVAQRRDDGARDQPQPVVTAATAESSTIELGHGVAGSWLPGSA